MTDFFLIKLEARHLDMKQDFCHFLILKCYKVTQKEVIPISGMLFNRSGAASVSINGYLWITGGRVMDVLLKTSEFVSLHSAIPGPDLPMPMFKHTLINIENYLTLLIGGQLDSGKSSTNTYYFNHTANEWSSGPKLNHGRFQVLRKMKLAQILALSVCIVKNPQSCLQIKHYLRSIIYLSYRDFHPDY